MIAQVQIVNIPNIDLAKERVAAAAQELVELADKVDLLPKKKEKKSS